jgi:CheY-like chemotaxis protein
MAAPRTVLVAEDLDDVRELVVLTLARAALVVLEAADGDAALALARSARPDLVLLDVLMPGTDGIAVCRALKADPATAATPVVLLTSQHDLEARVAEASADAYLTKPFSPAALLRLVQELLLT